VQGIGQESRCGERHLVVAVDLDDGAAVQAAAHARMPETRRHRLVLREGQEGGGKLAVHRTAQLHRLDPVIIAAHLGGVLPWLRDRIGLWGQNIPPLPGQPQPARPAGEYLDRLYVDTVGYGPAPLEYCYTQLGADRMLFGTDHPYAVPSVPQNLTDRLPCTPAEREQILAGNAQRLLRLNTAVPGRA
jgi:hypothetical protein